MKIITLCGSLKFKKEMMITAEKIALDGNCVIAPVYPVLEKYKKTDEQVQKLKEAHLKKIELSDAILVVNVDNGVKIYLEDKEFDEAIKKLRQALSNKEEFLKRVEKVAKSLEN